MDLNQEPIKELTEEELKDMSDDERMQYLLSLQNDPALLRRAYTIVLNLQPTQADRESFDSRYNTVYENYKRSLDDGMPANINQASDHNLSGAENSRKERRKARQDAVDETILSSQEDSEEPKQAIAKRKNEKKAIVQEADATITEKINAQSAADKSADVKAETEKRKQQMQLAQEMANDAKQPKPQGLPSKSFLTRNTVNNITKPVPEIASPESSDTKDSKADSTSKSEDLAESIPEYIGSVTAFPIKYIGSFTKYKKAFEEGNKKQLHDENSSVPYSGQVMPLGQIQFAINQGEKLEELLSKQGVSPLNASPADAAVLKRASAARREQQLQAVDRSAFDMTSAEKALNESIDRLKKGALLKIMPEMLAAKTPDEIKKVFDDAVNGGLINRKNIQADAKEVGRNAVAYSKAVEKHAMNLIKDGQEQKAQETLQTWREKVDKLNKENFLDDMGFGFGKKMDGLSEKMNEMTSNMINKMSSFTSRLFSRSPSPAP